ncbi:MAG: hypothetical protein A2W53_01060 [Nitrospinae bacterium RIFCSPHIGHO2_02_39_11]|nr:MAG: hypothetical protein A2W53_01060 [Nitrospinae bacterium RIFCSPHIGHO2_02_39_11]
MAIMSNSLKAALLSGLVFPGIGQVVLKRYRRGVVLMLIVLACLFIVVAKAVQQAFSVLKQIELAGGTINVDAILNVATQSSTNSDSIVFNSILLLIIVCWILGVVDAYRIGKKRDLEEQSTSQGSNSKGD